MENVFDKVVQKIKTHFSSSISVFETRVVYDRVLQKAEQVILQITTWSMRILLWILKAKNTLPECVILVALPLQP